MKGLKEVNAGNKWVAKSSQDNKLLNSYNNMLIKT